MEEPEEGSKPALNWPGKILGWVVVIASLWMLGIAVFLYIDQEQNVKFGTPSNPEQLVAFSQTLIGYVLLVLFYMLLRWGDTVKK